MLHWRNKRGKHKERQTEGERGTNWIRTLREHKTMTYCKYPDEKRQLDCILSFYLSFCETNLQMTFYSLNARLWFSLVNHKYLFLRRLWSQTTMLASFPLQWSTYWKDFFFLRQNAVDHYYLMLENVVRFDFPWLFGLGAGSTYILSRQLCFLKKRYLNNLEREQKWLSLCKESRPVFRQCAELRLIWLHDILHILQQIFFALTLTFLFPQMPWLPCSPVSPSNGFSDWILFILCPIYLSSSLFLCSVLSCFILILPIRCPCYSFFPRPPLTCLSPCLFSYLLSLCCGGQVWCRATELARV